MGITYQSTSESHRRFFYGGGETRKLTIVQGLIKCVMVLEYFGLGLVQLLVATVI